MTRNGHEIGHDPRYTNDHDGAITIRSWSMKGLNDQSNLPANGDEDPQESETQQPTSPCRETILLVDDELDLIEMCEQMLSMLGYSVVGETCPKAALNRFQQDPNRFDLVITDMSMPAMTGVDLARDLTKIRPDIPVILCTGFGAISGRSPIEDAGIQAIMKKPILRNTMAFTIRTVLDKAVTYQE
jgi:CheY-like chemotaxis protein